MNPIRYNYHTHTARCRHAIGTEREYIEIAVRNGITDMGFSDHAPFVFPDGHRSGYRVEPEDAPAYIRTLQELREEYKDQIRLHIGFEMEYYPAHFRAMLDNANALGAEYLILGQHFIRNEYPNGIYTGVPTTDEWILKEYVDEVIAAMKTGVFSYVAHPDICCFVGDNDIYTAHMRRLCAASKNLNVPLEINLLGIRDHRHYPCDKFFRIVSEEAAPVVIGFDAHDPAAAFDGASLQIAQQFIEEYNLHFLSDPSLKPCR